MKQEKLTPLSKSINLLKLMEKFQIVLFLGNIEKVKIVACSIALFTNLWDGLLKGELIIFGW